jgi:dTDP-4-amino-4,6-dideoxygalactose transaminase
MTRRGLKPIEQTLVGWIGADLALFEWFYSLPLITVDWGAGELGAALDALFLGKVGRTAPVRRLEDQVRALTGAQEAIAFENGRTALRWILEMAKARPEAQGRREVILPSLLCSSVASAVKTADLEPVLCDVTENLTMDPESARQVFDPERTLALIVPHIYAIPTAMDPFLEMAEPNGSVVIDDAAAALGSRQNGKALGLQAHAGIYSFSQGKAATAGGGGLAVLPSDSPFAGRLQERAPLHPALRGRALATFIRFLWFDVLHRFSDPVETLTDIVSTRLKLSWRRRPRPIDSRRMAGLQANVARVQINRLESRMKKWQENTAFLHEELKDVPGLRVLEVPKGAAPTRFLIETLELGVKRESAGIKEENPLVAHLRRCGIEARYVYLPLHRYAGGPEKRAPCLDNSDRLGNRLVHLPFLPPLGRGEMARVGRAVRSFFGR